MNALRGTRPERRTAVSRYELLLRWASECGHGSWSTFREAHDWLFNTGQLEGPQVRATTTIHGMSMLGHIEIDWNDGEWSIAPTSLTILPNAGAHAIVAGARTVEGLRAFWRATDNDDFFAESHSQEWGPDAVYVAANDESAIERLADRLGSNYELCVSERLASMLPSLEEYLAISRSTPAARGYGFDRFDVRFLKWDRATSDEGPGLYRYDLWGRPLFRFVSSAGTHHAVDLALGVHAEIARHGRNEIHYQADSINGTVHVPFAAQLPALQARTAALCTGLMPRLEDRKWAYPNVPRSTAEAIAASLGQKLLVTPRKENAE